MLTSSNPAALADFLNRPTAPFPPPPALSPWNFVQLPIGSWTVSPTSMPMATGDWSGTVFLTLSFED